MPDYNPKDIPTLDDIIEEDITDNSEPEDAGTEATKNDLDLFSEESIDPDTENIVIAETEPPLGDFHENEDEDDTLVIDVHSVESAPQVSLEPIEVGLVVKDLVKQIMPDLEQQLVSLLQQALEEKLPEEIIKSVDTTHEN